MAEFRSNEEVDAYIWAALQGSTCAQDYLDFIRHSSGRAAPYEEAFLQAEQYWPPTDSPDANLIVPQFGQVVAEMRRPMQVTR